MASEIPIYRSQVTTNPINLDLSHESLSQESALYAQASAINQQQTIKLSLKNSFSKYKNLAQQQIFESFQNNPTNQEGFNESLNTRKKEILSNAPRAIASDLESFMSSHALGFSAKIQSNKINLLNVELEKEKYKEIEMNANSIQALADGVISDNEQFRNDSINTLAGNLSSIVDSYATVGADGQPLFSAQQQYLGTKKVMDGFSTSVINAGYNKQKTLEQKEQYVRDLEEGKIVIPIRNFDGNIVESNAIQGLTNGQVGSMVSWMKQDINREKKLLEKENYNNWIKGSLEGTLTPDPSDPEYVKMVNDSYSNFLRPTLKDFPLDQRADRMIKFVKDNAVMPSVMVNEIKNWINSGNEQQILTASKFVSKSKEENLVALRDFDDKDLAKAYDLERSINAGINPKEAISLIRKFNDPETKEIYNQRLERFRSNVKEKNPDFKTMGLKAIKAGFLSIGRGKFPEDTQISEIASLDYKTLVEKAYLITNDWDKAVEIADTKFALLWNVSSTNGNKVMKYPPEAYYNVSHLEEGAMRNQLVEDVELIKTSNPNVNLDFDSNSAIIIADRRTASDIQESGMPSYVVHVKNDLGIYVPLEVDGKAFRWRPDINLLTTIKNVQLKEEAIQTTQTLNNRSTKLKFIETMLRSLPAFLQSKEEATQTVSQALEDSVNEPELNFILQGVQKIFDARNELALKAFGKATLLFSTPTAQSNYKNIENQ